MIINFYYRIPEHVTALSLILLPGTIQRLKPSRRISGPIIKLKPFRCGECNTRIVVMNTTTGSVIPVEVLKDSNPYTPQDEFNPKKHISHLMNCEALRKKWAYKKRRFLPKRRWER